MTLPTEPQIAGADVSEALADLAAALRRFEELEATAPTAKSWWEAMTAIRRLEGAANQFATRIARYREVLEAIPLTEEKRHADQNDPQGADHAEAHSRPNPPSTGTIRGGAGPGHPANPPGSRGIGRGAHGLIPGLVLALGVAAVVVLAIWLAGRP